MSRPGRQDLVERTSAEHGSISVCLAEFESILVAPASNGPSAWCGRLLHELTPLIECLGQHCTSAEASNGLLYEIEVTLGRSHEVSTARRLHRSAKSQAGRLSALLSEADLDTDAADLRRAGRRLASAIRRHHELEGDLILAAFDRDIGVGD